MSDFLSFRLMNFKPNDDFNKTWYERQNNTGHPTFVLVSFRDISNTNIMAGLTC
jgi:hypothetical protein